MAAVSIVLFGSRARGDFERDSDVDLLVINDSGQMNSKTLNKINIVYYPYDFLYSKSKTGDLFVLHLKLEAKVIFDPLLLFNNICDKFEYKKTYDEDIAFASAIGRLLVQHSPEFLAGNQLNKRIAWCIRTILIARSAELRRPVFSANALCEFADAINVYDLIKNKDKLAHSQAYVDKFELFLNEFGSMPHITPIMTLSEYKSMFVKTNNKMGLKVLRNIDKDIVGY